MQVNLALFSENGQGRLLVQGRSLGVIRYVWWPYQFYENDEAIGHLRVSC